MIFFFLLRGQKEKNIVLKLLGIKMMMDINKLSSRIVGIAIEVHKTLGPGLFEFHPVKYFSFVES